MRDDDEPNTMTTTPSQPPYIDTTNAPVLHEHHTRHADVHGDHPHHISHSVALTADVLDPAAAQHIVEVEKEWAEDKEDNLSDSAVSSAIPVTEKNDLSIDEEEKAEELGRVQSKASLAVMMANFPDGGRRAWLTLVGATLMAFATFGIPSSPEIYLPRLMWCRNDKFVWCL
jgi:hypothetical protein